MQECDGASSAGAHWPAPPSPWHFSQSASTPRPVLRCPLRYARCQARRQQLRRAVNHQLAGSRPRRHLCPASRRTTTSPPSTARPSASTGFPIRWARRGRSHPTVLMGPGWGSSGDTDTSQAGIQGALSIAQLWHGGFNVLTWDPRGFGHSGGEAEVDSPNDEGRDVSAMLNWVAQQAGVQLDRPGRAPGGHGRRVLRRRRAVRGGRTGLPD